MYFDLTDEERMIQETARDFANKEIAPVADKYNRECIFPKDIIQKLGQLGFMGINVPEEYGGANLGNFCVVLVLEEINRVCASTGVTVSVHHSLGNYPLTRYGTEAQKRKYLPKLASGEFIAAYALSEPDAGSDAASLIATAVKDGSEYVLNGVKSFITSADEAGLFVVMAKTDPSQHSKGISAFLIERDTPGLVIGKKEDKMGMRASCTNEIALEDLRVSADNLLGEVGMGFKIAMDALDGGRIGIGTQAVGIAQACLDASVAYAGEREQFGKPIGSFQAIQWMIANMATSIHAARLMVYYASRLKDRELPHTKEAAMAKLFASEMANKVAKDAVQIHGGAGYTIDFPVERYFRDAKVTEIYEGTSEIQRIVISRALLRE